jgi:hypothetical protein
MENVPDPFTKWGGVGTREIVRDDANEQRCCGNDEGDEHAIAPSRQKRTLRVRAQRGWAREV